MFYDHKSEENVKKAKKLEKRSEKHPANFLSKKRIIYQFRSVFQNKACFIQIHKKALKYRCARFQLNILNYKVGNFKR